MSSWIADAVGAEKGLTEGQGFVGKAEDTGADVAADNVINSELGKGEADLGLSDTGVEGIAEKAIDGFVDDKADNFVNSEINNS